MSGLVRGHAAPTGFSLTVTSYLRQFVARRQLDNPGAPQPVKERWRILEAVAHEPAGVGDQDPRVRTLWQATVAMFGPGVPAWSPGDQQKATIEIALHTGDEALHDGRLLNALAHAATLDVRRAAELEMAKMRRHEDLPPAAADTDAKLRERLESTERELREAKLTIESVRESHMAEKTQRRHLQSVLRGDAAIDADEETSKLPKGIRRRGDRFEALVYKGESGDGKQHGLGMFEQLEDAVKARAVALTHEAVAA